jgi:hypothetical protein
VVVEARGEVTRRDRVVDFLWACVAVIVPVAALLTVLAAMFIAITVLGS